MQPHEAAAALLPLRRFQYSYLTQKRLTAVRHARRDNQWDQEFADGVKFTGDPVVATPDVTEIQLKDDDEFVIIASDGLWCGAEGVRL